MKTSVRILSLLLVLGTTAVLLAGCGHGRHYYDDYYITIVNDSPWDVYVEPFGLFLSPGEQVDVEVGYDVFHVIVLRNFDALILAELDVASGDVLVVS